MRVDDSQTCSPTELYSSIELNVAVGGGGKVSVGCNVDVGIDSWAVVLLTKTVSVKTGVGAAGEQPEK